MTRNIGEGWREIAIDGKKVNRRKANQIEEELCWKQSRKKKKLSKEIQR